ncbi:unnamed protein product [Symbiodinium natans]|uniref:C3H1-type domain-containing protein n=1 Tax=Symbiodinium natans TaxID=878477 RepID=A0A812QTV5_9DINO|nr:unnamed protein product [Symbiodinium natans]
MMMPGFMMGYNETVVCSVHGKKRSRDAMMDDGVGGFTCQPGKECKVAGNTKHVPCAFFQAGKCTKGENCNFSHDPNAIAAASAASAGGAWGGGADAWGQDAGKGWDSSGWGGYGGSGYGSYGPKGGWYSSKGMGMMMAAKGMGKYGKSMKGYGGGYEKGGGTFLCSVHKKNRSASAVIEIAPGQYQCRPDSECKGAGGASKVKTAMCKFHMEGRCTKGYTCNFAHGPEELGMPVPEMAGAEMNGMAGIPGVNGVPGVDVSGVAGVAGVPGAAEVPTMPTELTGQAAQSRFSPY